MHGLPSTVVLNHDIKFFSYFRKELRIRFGIIEGTKF